MKKILFVLCAAAATLVACNKAEVAAPVANDDARVVKFSTRNLYSFETKAAMAANSQVSIFAGAPINANNQLYTVGTMPDGDTPGSLTGTSIKWGLEQMGTSTESPFYAIYPYYETRTLNTTTPLSWPITTAANVEEAMDVLVAYSSQYPGDNLTSPNSVSFNFTHPFALLEYTVTNNSDDTINYIELSGVYVNGSLVMSDALTNKGESTGTQRLFKSGEKYYGVVYPETGVTPVVTIHLYSGATATYTLAGTQSFVAGSKYSASLEYSKSHNGVTSQNTVVASFTVSQNWPDVATSMGETSGGTPSGGVSDANWPFLKGENATLNGNALNWDTGIAMKCIGANSFYAVVTLTAASAQIKVNDMVSKWYGWNGAPTAKVDDNGATTEETDETKYWKKYVGNGDGNIQLSGAVNDKFSVYFYINGDNHDNSEVWVKKGEVTR